MGHRKHQSLKNKISIRITSVALFLLFIDFRKRKTNTPYDTLPDVLPE